MKAIPKSELMEILEYEGATLITANLIEEIYNGYGDDYYFDYSKACWELSKTNPYRETLIRNIRTIKKERFK